MSGRKRLLPLDGFAVWEWMDDGKAWRANWRAMPVHWGWGH
jgi:hypothetical protein